MKILVIVISSIAILILLLEVWVRLKIDPWIKECDPDNNEINRSKTLKTKNNENTTSI